MLVNPISFRLSVSLFWKSTWSLSTNHNYKFLFYSDLVFFEFLWFFFKKMFKSSVDDFMCSHIRLYRVKGKIIINFYYYCINENKFNAISTNALFFKKMQFSTRKKAFWQTKKNTKLKSRILEYQTMQKNSLLKSKKILKSRWYLKLKKYILSEHNSFFLETHKHFWVYAAIKANKFNKVYVRKYLLSYANEDFFRILRSNCVLKIKNILKIFFMKKKKLTSSPDFIKRCQGKILININSYFRKVGNTFINLFWKQWNQIFPFITWHNLLNKHKNIKKRIPVIKKKALKSEVYNNHQKHVYEMNKRYKERLNHPAYIKYSMVVKTLHNFGIYKYNKKAIDAKISFWIKINKCPNNKKTYYKMLSQLLFLKASPVKHNSVFKKMINFYKKKVNVKKKKKKRFGFRKKIKLNLRLKAIKLNEKIKLDAGENPFFEHCLLYKKTKPLFYKSIYIIKKKLKKKHLRGKILKIKKPIIKDLYFLDKMIASKVLFNYNIIYNNIYFYLLSKLLKKEGLNTNIKLLKKFKLNFFKMHLEQLTSRTVARYILFALSRNHTIWDSLLPVIIDLKARMLKKQISGFKLSISGRFQRASRATYWWRKDGKLFIGTPTVGVDYTKFLLKTKYGVTAISILLSPGNTVYKNEDKLYPLFNPFFFLMKEDKLLKIKYFLLKENAFIIKENILQRLHKGYDTFNFNLIQYNIKCTLYKYIYYVMFLDKLSIFYKENIFSGVLDSKKRNEKMQKIFLPQYCLYKMSKDYSMGINCIKIIPFINLTFLKRINIRNSYKINYKKQLNVTMLNIFKYKIKIY